MFERKSAAETVKILKSDAEYGLSAGEAKKRLEKEGRNELKEKRGKTVIESFFEQLSDPLIYVLIVAAVVSVILREISDSIIIGVVVFVNAIIGILQEGKAKRALDALKKLTSPHTIVIRDGKKEEMDAAYLVPGDIVCLEAGSRIPADLRLIETVNLNVEEAVLTGENLSVEKDERYIVSTKKEAALGDRINMGYMSTVVTGGRGKGIVTATGMNTEIGKIASMIEGSKEEPTPLQKRLGELGGVLSVLSLVLCAILFFIAIWQKRNIFEMLITAISLAVAAVPEGLPAVVTICLALSVTKLVRVNTIVRKLPSVETLGSVSVVCSDKTGTLTQNKMTVEKVYTDEKICSMDELEKSGARSENISEMLKAFVLCNDSYIDGENRVGDPTELALLDMALKFNISKRELERKMPRRDEIGFDSDRKMMTTYNGASFTKGAPDEILKRCAYIRIGSKNIPMTKSHREKIMAAVSEMAKDALRTIAASMKTDCNGVSEKDMIFLGIAGMKDPARPEAKKAVETFKKAGVRTVMITGDYLETAFAIGKQLGIAKSKSQCMSGDEMDSLSDNEFDKRLEDAGIFARVSPKQKVRIVDGFKRKGMIVAMTGDGVNDAPSLKAADIGIAMGIAGTDVAKGAADMILVDDNFATIEKAIEEGRGVYENIRKSVIFLLSSNLGEILTMFLAVIFGLASPLKPSHILWINLITDSLPALALGVDVNDKKSLMENSPRKADESLFSRGGLACTCFYGMLITGISLAAFLLLPIAWIHSKGYPVTIENLKIILSQSDILVRSQTYAFTVLGMSQLFHAVGMKNLSKSVFRMKHLENKLMIFACVAGFLLQFAVTKIPVLINAFGTVCLNRKEWILLAILAAFPMLAHEVMILMQRSAAILKKC